MLKAQLHDDMDLTDTNSQRSQCSSDCASGQLEPGKDVIRDAVWGCELTASPNADITS